MPSFPPLVKLWIQIASPEWIHADSNSSEKLPPVQLFRETMELQGRNLAYRSQVRSQPWKSDPNLTKYVVMTSKALNSTSRQSFGIVATLSRAQVVQFLNSHSVSDSPSTSSYETSPLFNVLPSKVSDPGRRIIKTPVMHPNLVYTLKSWCTYCLQKSHQSLTTQILQETAGVHNLIIHN